MHTGDLATIDEDNFIFIVDRAKDMIVSGGENVYCAEVENALYDHPDVLEAAVIGIPDERWGEAVLAIVVPKEGTDAERRRTDRALPRPASPATSARRRSSSRPRRCRRAARARS